MGTVNRLAGRKGGRGVDEAASGTSCGGPEADGGRSRAMPCGRWRGGWSGPPRREAAGRRRPWRSCGPSPGTSGWVEGGARFRPECRPGAPSTAGPGAGWRSACSAAWCAAWPACVAGRRGGRRPQPRPAIIDTQTVTCLPVRGPRGYDAAGRVVGRERVALVDADGNWLAVAVVPASVRERGALPAPDAGKAAWPSLRVVILGGAFTAERCRECSNLHGMRHEVVARPPDQKGFAVLPRRWIVERSFGGLTHRGGLLRDRAGRLDVAAARIACTAPLDTTEAQINPGRSLSNRL